MHNTQTLKHFEAPVMILALVFQININAFKSKKICQFGKCKILQSWSFSKVDSRMPAKIEFSFCLISSTFLMKRSISWFYVKTDRSLKPIIIIRTKKSVLKHTLYQLITQRQINNKTLKNHFSSMPMLINLLNSIHLSVRFRSEKVTKIETCESFKLLKLDLENKTSGLKLVVIVKFSSDRRFAI